MCRHTRHPLHRLSAAFIVVLSLLFSQLALAAYVCPSPADASAKEAMAAMVAAGAPCAGMDQAQPALCHQIAADVAQSVEGGKLPAMALRSWVHVLWLSPVLLPVITDTLPAALARQARPPPAPLFLATRRLRV